MGNINKDWYVDFLQSDFGHVMENIIYNEWIYRGYSVNVGVVVIYSKNEKIFQQEHNGR